MKLRICCVLLVLILAACSGGADTPDTPGAAVENYLRTRITGDENKVVALTCKAREGDARAEAASFGAMKANIESLSCTTGAQDGTYIVVGCVGKMVTTYAGETRNWDFAARQYKTIQEDGRWKVCGTK